jgi:regulator of sigma E protease
MMDLFSILGGFGGSVFGYVIPFLFVLTIVVFFHELGHFLVGRWCGVKVLTFSIGFGPEIAGFVDRKGTRWRFAAFPLGGYVKFFGDANAASAPDADGAARMTESERAVSFYHKPVLQRALIVAAGPIANFLLAIVIFAGLFATYGKDRVTPRVSEVVAGSPAESVGIRAGDIVLSIDGQRIEVFADIPKIVSVSAGRPLDIQLERQGSRLTVSATPVAQTLPGSSQPPRGTLGIRGTLEPEGPVNAVWLAVKETGNIISQTMHFLSRLVVGEEDTKDLGGPIKIAQISKQVAETSGVSGLILLAAVLSVSIGLLNLFPIPLLDGGHLVFYAVEAARGRPLGTTTQEMLFRVGFAFVIFLMLFGIWNDIVHPFPG